MTALRDAAALLAFVAVGVATHHASAGAFGRDAACFLGGWFAAAALTRLYTCAGWWRLAATWVVGVSAAVLARAAFVGHVAYDFWGVALGFTAVFVYAVRFSATAWSRSRISATSPPRSSNRGS
ncbi:MAG TPA: DUF3054 family protein [Gaiellaceae bacterium]|nr:DUF3054 family protein [Gaiellaceae bacterium]